MEPCFIKHVASGKLTSTLADRGWKTSFHQKLVIFRVYVYLPEGTIFTIVPWLGNAQKIQGFLMDIGHVDSHPENRVYIRASAPWTPP